MKHYVFLLIIIMFFSCKRGGGDKYYGYVYYNDEPVVGVKVSESDNNNLSNYTLTDSLGYFELDRHNKDLIISKPGYREDLIATDRPRSFQDVSFFFTKERTDTIRLIRITHQDSLFFNKVIKEITSEGYRYSTNHLVAGGKIKNKDYLFNEYRDLLEYHYRGELEHFINNIVNYRTIEFTKISDNSARYNITQLSFSTDSVAKEYIETFKEVNSQYVEDTSHPLRYFISRSNNIVNIYMLKGSDSPDNIEGLYLLKEQIEQIVN